MSKIELKDKVVCPECGSKEFQLGPRGGSARNIRCRCGYVLNVCQVPDGRFWIEKIGYQREVAGASS